MEHVYTANVWRTKCIESGLYSVEFELKNETGNPCCTLRVFDMPEDELTEYIKHGGRVLLAPDGGTNGCS